MDEPARAAVERDHQEISGAELIRIINMFIGILRAILRRVRRKNDVSAGIKHIEIIVIGGSAERIAPKQIRPIIVSTGINGVRDHSRRKGKKSAGPVGAVEETGPIAAIDKITLPSA